MVLGVHSSIRLGYDRAILEAKALGCKALQIFCYRRHHVDPAAEELAAFREGIEGLGVRLIVHVRYLPSLASSDAKRREHSAVWLARELRISSAISAESLIIHAGAFSEDSSAKDGMRLFVEGAVLARDMARTELPLLVENVPGGGRRMCGTLEEMRDLGGLLERERFSVGYCLDTAHAYAHGYEIGSAEGMAGFLDSANLILGKERVRAFHVNETQAEPGSHREHHWHWGDGRVGLDGLRHLLSRPDLANAVGIIETPKGERNAENYHFVRRVQR